MNKIEINTHLYLTEFEQTDIPALTELLNNENIANQTLLISHPYTESTAEWFIKHCEDSKKNLSGVVLNWAIRNTDNRLLGGISRFCVTGVDGHRDELAYWVGQPYWRQGIASEVVRVFSDYLLEHTRIERLEAFVFEQNENSMNVLLKAGFQREGYFKKYYVKNGLFKNVFVYAKY
jgi:RimJ/RimL family protein N-acetyltransferase